jgi:hypothetical protein
VSLVDRLDDVVDVVLEAPGHVSRKGAQVTSQVLVLVCHTSVTCKGDLGILIDGAFVLDLTE